MAAARLSALDWMCERAREKQRETHGPNRSPLIDRINRNAGVPLGSPYCASAIKLAFKEAAGIDDFGGGLAASVEYMERWAAEKGWLHTRPFAGDAFSWDLAKGKPDGWADHAGMVVKVRSWGGILFTVDTVEANTSASSSGSQDDGGGFHFRRRTFRRGYVSFVRDPRETAVVGPPPKKPTKRKAVPRFHVRDVKGRMLASRKTPGQIAAKLDELEREFGKLTVERA